MSQPALPGLDAAPALSDRQSFALQVIRERAPIRSETLGAYLCERTGRHSHSDACDYDASNGREVGEALHRKDLVRYVRGKGWVPVGWAARRGGYDPATAEVPF